MQPDKASAKHLRHIAFALWALAIAALSIAGTVVYGAFQTPHWSDSVVSPGAEPQSTSQCAVDKFFRDTSALMEKAKYKDVLAAVDARLIECPSDHYAYWFRGKALAIEGQWGPALEALNRAELLRPDWRRQYIEPLRDSIERQRSDKKK